MSKRKRLVVDGTNAMHRAYHAVPPMKYKGTPTNAIVGFFRILQSKINQIRPDEIIVTFDVKSKNFRHKLHAEYKGKRIKDPEKSKSLKIQTPIIVDLLEAMGIACVAKRGIEADDIVNCATFFDGLVYVLSSDKDFGQCLVRKNVILLNPAKDLQITYKNCKEVFGVAPNRVIDFLMLDGDDIDNIDGIPGIGPKTAIKLIEEFGKAESIPFERFPKGARETVNISKRLKLNRKLVTFIDDAYDVSNLDMSISPVDVKRFAAICTKYKLNDLRNRVLN